MLCVTAWNQIDFEPALGLKSSGRNSAALFCPFPALSLILSPQMTTETFSFRLLNGSGSFKECPSCKVFCLMKDYEQNKKGFQTIDSAT